MVDYTEKGMCCLCGGEYDNFGNNPFPFYPYDNEKRCCTICGRAKVLPARLLMHKIDDEQFCGEFEADKKKLFEVFESVKYTAAETLDFFYNEQSKNK